MLIKDKLDRANPSELGDLLAQTKLGTALEALVTLVDSGSLTVGSDAVTLPSKAFHIEAVEALTATAETGTAGPKVRTLASTPGAGQFTLGSDGVTVTFAAADEVLTAKALYVPVPAYLAALAVDEPDLP